VLASATSPIGPPAKAKTGVAPEVKVPPVVITRPKTIETSAYNLAVFLPKILPEVPILVEEDASLIPV
jgi:hypothetical protein